MKLATLINLTRQARNEFSFDVEDCRAFAESLNDGETDFEVGTVRFIETDAIDAVMADELSGDEYVLGCFNAWFLANVLEIDQDVIEAMQSSEAFEAIGKLVISLGKLEELQKAYAGADGYGHHFNHYDGGEIEIFAGDVHLHSFDNR